ncbi:MAG: hypothetical protein M1840_005344 [Geoglossum simile]|nr:MAG: hypothetical protein M1840_005344 [Geoglossum simile]
MPKRVGPAQESPAKRQKRGSISGIYQNGSTFSSLNGVRNGNINQVGNIYGRDVTIGSTPRVRPSDVYQWLSSFQHEHKHGDVLSKRSPGTGTWLLGTPQFRNWRHNPHSKRYLWCHGTLGTGKTVLTSSVVDELARTANEGIGVAFFYCDYADRDDQTAAKIIASLVKQLSLQKPSTLDQVRKLYDHCGGGEARPVLNRLTETFRDILFIVVDALDECKDECRKSLLAQFEKADSQAVRYFLTSRPLPNDIGRKLDKFLQIEIKAKECDIRRILEDDNLSELMKNAQPLVDEIITTIVRKAKDMFLLASLQFDMIRSSTTRNEIRIALKEVPTDLHISFKLTLERIEGQSENFKNLAHRIISWLSHTKRPLSVHGLQQFLAVRLGHPSLEEDDIPEQQTMIHTCMGLVTIDHESSTIRLVHNSLREYLQGLAKPFYSPGATIAGSCLTVLSLGEFNRGCCYSDREFESRLRQFPAFAYAAHNWGYHVLDETGETNKEMLLGFLQSDLKVSSATQAMLAPSHGRRGYSQIFPTDFTGLHLASFFGLKGVVSDLLTNNANPNAEDSYRRRPLSLAAEEGQEAVVGLFLKKGAEVRASDKWGRTALHQAAMSGHKEVVLLLLENGADLDAKEYSGRGRLRWGTNEECSVVKRPSEGVNSHMSDISKGGHEAIRQPLPGKGAVRERWRLGRTALQSAAEEGHELVARLLLERGANVEAKDSDNRTVLRGAAENGYEAVVRLLLGWGASVEAKDIYGRTALHWAARKGYEAVVRLLVEKEADVEIKAHDECTALHWAASHGHKGVVQLLLEKGADAEVKDSCGLTALQWAAYLRHGAVTQLLLKETKGGAKERYERAMRQVTGLETEGVAPLLLDMEGCAEVKASEGWTAMHRAASLNQDSVMRLLLKMGADAEVEDSYGRTALNIAAYNGHEAVARPLLEMGANIGSRDLYGLTAMHVAASRGHDAVVRLLLERGANVDAEDLYRRTVLYRVAESGHETVARMLLQKGANVNTKDKYNWTALHEAAQGEHEEVARMLLEAGADINAQVCNGKTALHLAAKSGNGALVQLLLENGPEVDASDGDGETALHEAADKGHEVVVRLLLEGGADVDTKSFSGLTAVHLAAFNGNETMTQLLLKEAEVDAEDDDGETALHLAAYSGHEAVARLLLEKGANATAETKYGYTALDLALTGGHDAVTRLLTPPPALDT